VVLSIQGPPASAGHVTADEGIGVCVKVWVGYTREPVVLYTRVLLVNRVGLY
jgi:hypothetical protein